MIVKEERVREIHFSSLDSDMTGKVEERGARQKYWLVLSYSQWKTRKISSLLH